MTHTRTPQSQAEKNSRRKSLKRDSWQPNPKIHVVAGFLRLINFLCASGVLFGLVISLWMEGNKEANNTLAGRVVTKSILVIYFGLLR